jgi:protocatechuate 3,4-dioxygenase beta subunit
MDVMDRSRVAGRVPLTVKLRLTSASSGRPISGNKVRLWHCDGDGALAGTDPNGWVTFTSVFPATEAGRWPHLHFEVVGRRTAQLALPGDACVRAYAAEAYGESKRNLARSSPADALRDGMSLEMASVTGDVDRGFVATRTVGV